MGRAPWDAPLNGLSPEPSLSPSHRTLEGAPWHERHSYGITYFFGRLRVKYEEVYLHAYEGVAAVRTGLGRYFRFYNAERRHQQGEIAKNLLTSTSSVI